MKLLTERPFRECLNAGPDEVLVFGCDITTQPQYEDWAVQDPYLHLKCSRALPVARKEDIVVLSGPLDEEYYAWLKELGMGPERIVSYGEKTPRLSLPELIRANPEPLRKAVAKTGRKPVWVPFYSSKKEEELCRAEGFRLFGCPEEITLKFFDKRHFKNLCRQLGLQTVEGVEFELAVDPADSVPGSDLERLILALLHSHSSVVVRGALGSAGKSVYEVNSKNIAEALRLISNDNGKQFLIEPLLQVVASPNDQWCITEDGQISHLGTSAQLFAGFKHVGNLYGQYLSKRVTDGINKNSLVIAEFMQRAGYRGIFGIDYIVSDQGVFPIENNARLNGSTFAIGIFDNMRERNPELCCWKFFRTRIPPCNFSEARERLRPLLFEPGRINSVFPFDCDLLKSHGVFAVLLAAEDLYHIEYLEKALGQLGVEKI